jgi:hypothetical protein
MKKIAVLDFETDPFKHGRIPRVFSCGFFDGKTHQIKWGQHEDVLDWTMEIVKNFDGLVYAHNGGKFDYVGYLLPHARELIYGEPVMCIGGRVVRVKLGLAELRDSYAILPSALKKFDKGEIDYNNFEADKRENFKEPIIEYLKRDCESLYNAVTEFQETHGQAVLTAASAGMNYIKKLDIKVDILPEWLDKKFRHYYFGGLVLARKPGIHRGNYKIYDINSAYPASMMEEHWSGESGKFSTIEEDVTPQSFVCFVGKAKCFLRRENNKNEWGGEGKFYITGWEYLAAKQLGLIDGYVQFVEIPDKTTNFSPYVKKFYQDKQDAELAKDFVKRQISKIMLNAPYGKFAQNPEDFMDYVFMPQDTNSKEREEQGYDIAAVWAEHNLAIWEKPANSNSRYNVCTAASITGYVRAQMMRAIAETDPYYCDTDCVMVDANKLPSNIGSELGRWKLEAEGDTMYIAGKKLYAFRKNDLTWKLATKGVRLTPDELFKICNGETVKYRNEAPTFSLLSEPNFSIRSIRATA